MLLQLGIRFVTFFSKLTEMMERRLTIWNMLLNMQSALLIIRKYRRYVCSRFAREMGGRLRLQGICNIYGDLLEFCRGARKVVINEEGSQRREGYIENFQISTY